jgi:hypothetical protein
MVGVTAHAGDLRRIVFDDHATANAAIGAGAAGFHD